MSCLKKFEPIPQLTEDENNILTVKYSSVQFGRMSDAELFTAVRILVLKIHVIAGWSVPEKELKNILIDQLTKKIKESYGAVNAEEIEYAFRQTTVQDWGKNMNLSLIDVVISDYLERRLNISRLEEKYKTPIELPPPKEEPMGDEEFIQMNFKTWLVLKNYGIISIKCYGILVKQYKINLTQADKDAIYQQVEKILKDRMATDKFWYDELQPIFTNPDLWKTRVLNECKRKAIENYFLTLIPTT